MDKKGVVCLTAWEAHPQLMSNRRPSSAMSTPSSHGLAVFSSGIPSCSGKSMSARSGIYSNAPTNSKNPKRATPEA